MGRIKVELRFYGPLGDFLPAELRGTSFIRSLPDTTTVKDAIESIGVPHPEVELLLVDGVSVRFDRQLREGERIAAYPPFARLEAERISLVRPPPLEEPRFIADVHLGKLARLLRLLGFDAAYGRELKDAEIERRALAEERIVLTRDLGLLKRGSIRRGYWVRSQDPARQIREVVARFALRDRVRPYRFCLKCNGPISPASPEEVAASLKRGTAGCYRELYRCIGCGQVYWRGAHFRGLERLIGEAMEAGSDGGAEGD